MPLEIGGVTGGACDPCTKAMLEGIRRQTGWAYHVVLSRTCGHLLEEVSRLLQSWPHVKVLVDRRPPAAVHATPPPIYPGMRRAYGVPPRPHHLVIRRDCAHLYEDMAPLFAARPYIRVVVDRRVLMDRRNRSRTPSNLNLPPSQKPRTGDPPAWMV